VTSDWRRERQRSKRIRRSGSERELLIERDWYELGEWNLENGTCRSCGYQIAGRFEEKRGGLGRRRVPVRLAV